MILRSSLRPELDAEVVAFHGELDAAAAPDLADRLAEVEALPGVGLLIDLTDCSFIDSLGIGSVISGSKALREQDRAVVVAASSPQVRRVLSLTGADELLTVHWSRADAVEWLRTA